MATPAPRTAITTMSLNSIGTALGLMGTPGGLSTPPRAGRLPVGRSGPESRSPLGSASSEKWKEGFLMRKDSRGCELFLAVRSHQFGAFSSEPSEPSVAVQ